MAILAVTGTTAIEAITPTTAAVGTCQAFRILPSQLATLLWGDPGTVVGMGLIGTVDNAAGTADGAEAIARGEASASTASCAVVVGAKLTT
jgi:hypothetical protein